MTSSVEQPLLAGHTVVDSSDWSSNSSSLEYDPEKRMPSSTAGIRQASKLQRRLFQGALLLSAIFLVHLLLDGKQACQHVPVILQSLNLLESFLALQGEYQLPSKYLNKLLQKDQSFLTITGSDAIALTSDIYPSLSNLCNICDCSTDPPTYLAARSQKHSSSSAQRSDLPQLVRNAILDIQCQQIYSTRLNSLMTIRSFSKDPSSVLTWDLSRLNLHIPTTYMFTKTVPTTTQSERNVKDNVERSGYMQRHAETIHRFGKKMETTWKGHYEDGTPAKDRQIVWIIVEDNGTIDPTVAATLAEADINFVYFAFGPTR